MTAKKRQFFSPFILLTLYLIFFVPGCWMYSFQGGGPPADVQKIAVTLFANQTDQVGLSEGLATRITERLVSDGRLSVVTEAAADAILTGTVTGYDLKPFTYDQSGQVQQYQVKVRVTCRLERVKTGAILWNGGQLENWGVYANVTEQESKGREAALTKLGEDIYNGLFSTW